MHPRVPNLYLFLSQCSFLSFPSRRILKLHWIEIIEKYVIPIYHIVIVAIYIHLFLEKYGKFHKICQQFHDDDNNPFEWR